MSDVTYYTIDRQWIMVENIFLSLVYIVVLDSKITSMVSTKSLITQIHGLLKMLDVRQVFL